MSVIAATEFKAKCLRVLDQVNKTGKPVTITKRGKPVARIVPISGEPESSYGIAKGTISYADDDDLFSTAEDWYGCR